MKRALIIGEALIDIVSAPGQEVREHVGGSPANVALGLARLTRNVELATWYGSDERGESITGHLKSSGVKIVGGSDQATHTSTALATLDDTGAAQYTFDLEWRVPPVHLDSTLAVLHTGSIAATLSPGASAVAELTIAAREYATISYDPNARPSIMGTPESAEPLIERVAAAADIIKVSDEDFQWLYPHLEAREVARTWATQGPAIVVVTLGGGGSFAVTSQGVEVNVNAPRVDVVDTVGAGDSYMGGLIDGLWRRELLGAANRGKLHQIDAAALTEVMQWAGRIAAITVSRAGANPPTLPELRESSTSTEPVQITPSKSETSSNHDDSTDSTTHA